MILQRRFILSALAAIILASVLSGGCAGWKKTPYNSDAPWHVHAGREYAAQGRYELAKEHFLLALASNNDPKRREQIVQEVKAMDLMIQTQR